MRFGFAVAMCLLCIACDDDGEGSGAGGGGGGGQGGDGGSCGEACNTTCPEGFQTRDGASGCEPILAASCPAGTMPRLGSTACESVGSSSCPAGFVTDETGFGCTSSVPAAPCQGATRSAVGSPGCVPVGDCASTFPPQDATLFVDDDYGPGDLDATHFATIGEAVSAAPSGAVIAIDAGTYAESIDVTTALTLVGRCPAEVVVTDVGDGKPGLQALGVAGTVSVRGMTFTGHLVGVAVQNGELEATDVVVDGARSVGALASEAGGLLTLSSSVVRKTAPNAAGNSPWGVGAQFGARVVVRESDLSENDFANAVAVRDGASVEILRSVVRDGRAQSVGAAADKFGMGLYAYEGGVLRAEECVVTDNESAGAIAAKTAEGSGAPSHIELVRTLIQRTRREVDGEYGRGLSVDNGATARVEDGWIVDNEGGNAVVVDASLVLEGGLLAGVVGQELALLPNLQAYGAVDVAAEGVAILFGREVGVATQQGAVVSLERSLIAYGQPGPASQSPGGGGALGFGITAASGSSVELHGCALIENQGASIVTAGDASGVTLDETLVLSTLPTGAGQFGRGVEASQGASVTVHRSALLGHHEIGLLSGLGAKASVTESVIGGIEAGGAGFGHGALSLQGATLSLDQTTVFGAAGIGVAAADATAIVQASIITGCSIGVHAQDGVEIVEADAPTGGLQLVIDGNTAIVDNEVRFGSGVLSMPSPIGGTP